MSPMWSIWRLDSDCFLDLTDTVKAKDARTAIRGSRRARNGHHYIALPLEATENPLNSHGDPPSSLDSPRGKAKTPR